jgi:diguanylate cyclase (GGDEF)-like protein/PAS domain S-box-containing protein
MKEPIRLLLTEDVAADAELEVRELKRAGLRVAHKVADTEDGFRRELREFKPDLILSDFSMPGFDGMLALAIAREEAPQTPFIFVSGTIGEEYAIRALKNGATDYVLKANLVRLPAAVERALEDAAAVRARRKAEAELATTQERLERALAVSGVSLWDNDVRSGSVFLSKEWSRMLGGAAQETRLTPQELLALVHPDDEERVRALAVSLARGEIGDYEIEHRVRRQEGDWIWILSRGRVVERAADGGALRIVGTNVDIQQRKAVEQRLARLSRVRELFGAISSAIVRLKDRKELFGEFCRIAVARGGFVLARVVELDREGKAHIAANTEADSRLFQKMVDAYNADPASAPSLLAQALRGGQPVVSNSIATDARVSNRAALTHEGDYSLALLPILVEGRVAGTVALRAREPGSFDPDEMRLLLEMVSNIALALESITRQEKLEYAAMYDLLTGLPNRALFVNRLTQSLEATRREGDRLALVVFDLERFKAINDTYGRDAGDQVLKEVAQRLRRAAAGENRVARLGVDQFALMLPAVREATDAARVLGDVVLSAIEAPISAADNDVRIAARAGVALFPEDGGDPDALLRNAEASLKQAKANAERFLFYAPEINARISEQVELEHQLRKAVEAGELFLHFQPKLDLATRRVVGLEALMRWDGANGKPVSPARFVPVLEQTGLILEAGRQALARANAIYRDWRGRGLNAPRIAVNVSALQLRRRGFVDEVFSAIGWRAESDCGVDIEITESLLMSDIEESMRKLRTLRDAGIHVALDDFGTGHSSLAYLSKLPVDTLKIDRAFVHGMTANADDTSIVSTIISLAQALRLKVVAEGVETEEQAQLLRLLRCDEVQGYLFFRPQPAEKIEELLKAL